MPLILCLQGQLSVIDVAAYKVKDGTAVSTLEPNHQMQINYASIIRSLPSYN